MRRFTARVTVVGITAGMVAALVPATGAAATSGDTIHGGCSFDTSGGASVEGMPPPSDTETGVIFDASATFDASGAPTFATVSCQVQINDVAAPGSTFSYSGFAVQAGANPVTFTQGPLDSAELCQRVQYADGTDTGWVCPNVEPPPNPLTGIINTIGSITDAANTALNQDVFIPVVDPALCPILVSVAGDYGPISIRSDGDVYVPDPLDLFTGAPVYDCPPYGNF